MKGWIVLLTGLLLLSCATGKNMRTLDKDFGSLQSRINILQKESKSIKNEVSDMRARNQELKTDLSLLLDNLESEIRTLSTSFEDYKEFLKRTPEEISRFKEEMSSRLRSEEGRRTQEKRVTEIEDRFKALNGKTDRLLIRVNSWNNQ